MKRPRCQCGAMPSLIPCPLLASRGRGAAQPWCYLAPLRVAWKACLGRGSAPIKPSVTSRDWRMMHRADVNGRCAGVCAMKETLAPPRGNRTLASATTTAGGGSTREAGSAPRASADVTWGASVHRLIFCDGSALPGTNGWPQIPTGRPDDAFASLRSVCRPHGVPRLRSVTAVASRLGPSCRCAESLGSAFPHFNSPGDLGSRGEDAVCVYNGAAAAAASGVIAGLTTAAQGDTSRRQVVPTGPRPGPSRPRPARVGPAAVLCGLLRACRVSAAARQRLVEHLCPRRLLAYSRSEQWLRAAPGDGPALASTGPAPMQH